MNTQTQEALKLAIETNEWLKSNLWVDSLASEELDKVTNACKEALEAEQVRQAQEPVGYLQEESPNGKGFFATYLPMKDMKNKPLYTHPHQWQGNKEFVTLTDDEVYKCQHPEYPDTMYFAHNLEKALALKNGMELSDE